MLKMHFGTPRLINGIPGEEVEVHSHSNQRGGFEENTKSQ